jgi:multidrug resistance protein
VNAKLVVLFVTALVDMIGLVLVIPFLPFYAERMGASSAEIGILIGAFSAAQLVSAPWWGKLSDHYGRRPLLIIGLGASAAAYVVFAFATNYWLLLASRVVQGLGGGTVGVVQAYVTDLTPPNERAKTLGWLSAATSLGAVLGPAMGSLLVQAFGRPAPGLAAAALSFVNMIFAWQFLRESHEFRTAATGGARGPGAQEVLWRVLRSPGSAPARLIWMYTIAIGAFYGMPAVFTQLLERRFQVTDRTIGYFFMWFGATGVISRLFLLGPAVKRLGELRLSRLGLALLGLGMILFPLAPNFLVLAVSCVLMPLGTAFTFPGVTALLSRVVPNESRGLYMGVQQTFGGVARTAFPWVDGIAFDHYGMASPFVAGGMLCAATIGLAIGMERRVGEMQHAKREGAPA